MNVPMDVFLPAALVVGLILAVLEFLEAVGRPR